MLATRGLGRRDSMLATAGLGRIVRQDDVVVEEERRGAGQPPSRRPSPRLHLVPAPPAPPRKGPFRPREAPVELSLDGIDFQALPDGQALPSITEEVSWRLDGPGLRWVQDQLGVDERAAREAFARRVELEREGFEKWYSAFVDEEDLAIILIASEV